MPFERTTKRYAHVNGYTYCCYSENGKKIFTCGADGDLRIWSEIGDEDPSSECVGETANCLVQYDDRILVAVDNNTVQSFFHQSGSEIKRDGIEFRFTAPVNTLKVNKKYFAAGSEDTEIKVQVKSKKDEVFELKKVQKGPILHIDLSPKNLLASSSGDGTIVIWDLETKSVIKTLDGFQKINSFEQASIYTTPSFEPQTGRYLAYPKDQAVIVLETANWTNKYTLRNDLIVSNYSVCSFSKCGQYIAAGTVKGEITVWNLSTNAIVNGAYKDDQSIPIISIDWSPLNNGEFAYCDKEGQLGTVVNCYGTFERLSNGKPKASSKKSGSMFIDDEVDEDDGVDDIYGEMGFHDAGDAQDSDEENENCVSLERLKNETMKINGLAKSDSESDDEMKPKENRPVSSLSVRSERPPAVVQVQLQSAFQPGATPSHLEHRFMVWNHVGKVLSHKTDNENSILAEFHDVSVNPTLHIINNFNHKMCSLSTTCLALATSDTPCKLVCIVLGGGNKEWSVGMPGCEEIQAVAAAESFVAIATDALFVRCFTIMGTQREVISIPGPVVAMSGFDDKLLIAHHNSTITNSISLMLLQNVGFSICNREIKLPLSQDSRVTWLGFTDRGSPVINDSQGVVRCYSIKRNVWYPICETTLHIRGASDNFFIISVSEAEQTIRAILCRGTSYPLTQPRPIVTELKFSLPLCDIETEKSRFEDILLRSLNFKMDSARSQLLQNAMKLFTAALNSELESRAFELIEAIDDLQLIELAAKYASSKGRMHMAEKISKLQMNIEEKQKEKEDILKEFENESETYCNQYDTPTNKKIQEKNEETSTPLIAPKPMITQKNRNPFKKSITLKVAHANPLSHLTSKVIGYQNDSSSNMDSEDENTTPNNKTLNRTQSQDTPRPMNFMSWYLANKEELKASNPDVNDKDLSALALTMYRDLTKKQEIPDFKETLDSSTNSPLSALTNHKRKLEMNDSNSSGVSKLAKFGFTSSK